MGIRSVSITITAPYDEEHFWTFFEGPVQTLIFALTGTTLAQQIISNNTYICLFIFCKSSIPFMNSNFCLVLYSVMGPISYGKGPNYGTP
jgi:hypothetical protein